MDENTFIMKATPQCEKALRYWLNKRPKFNSYNEGWGGKGFVGVGLVLVDKPDSDWGKVIGECGKIICKGDDDGFKAREIVLEILDKRLQ